MASRFGWYELYTTDIEAAKAFYGAVAGLTTSAWEGSSDYTMWVGATGPIGGLMLLPEQAKAMGAPPHWMGYIGVTNVADKASQVTAKGGKVYVPPTDLPNGARFAIVSDADGAAFGLHQPGQGEPQTEPKRGLGDVCWNELMTSELEKGFAFYAELFGWEKKDAMDMGESGVYQTFGLPGKDAIGGMMKRPAGMPQSAWMHYLTVADVGPAADKVKAHGGQVLHGSEKK